MRKSVRFMFALGAALAVHSAMAGESEQPLQKQLLHRGDGSVEARVTQRVEAPLLFALPAARSFPEAAKLQIRIGQGKAMLVRETVMVPAHAAPDATIDVLATHPDELKRLRSLEAARPGSIRFIAIIGEEVIADEPLSQLESASKSLSTDAAVGAVQEIESHPERKLQPKPAGLYIDPGCQEYCDEQYNSCLDWCDPRGDSCTLCYTWYNDCTIQCPIDCSEPRSVSTYTTNTLIGSTSSATSCRANTFGSHSGQLWSYVTYQYQVTTYQRTMHCDGSYTDVSTGSTTTSGSCWQQTSISCSSLSTLPYGPPYPAC